MIKKRYDFEVLDSTNEKAKELAKTGAIEGTLITAQAQSAGVGRRGRSWSSEKGAGIYMSMILRPEIETEYISQITLVAALAVAKAMEELLGKTDLAIKWPNDLVLNKKKICGILTELSLKETKVDYVILGIGINVSNEKFPEEIKETASSIFLETKKGLSTELLIKKVWEYFQRYYESFLETKDLSLLKAEYEGVLVNKEKQVRVLDPQGEYTGTAKGITKTGALLVETEGEVRQVSSGEVSVRGIYGYV